MSYKAKYGEVNVGDYVIVVTNDYMHRSSDIDIGKVHNDGYVYTGVVHPWQKPDKPIRRQIGSFGCPVCRIDNSLVSKEKAEEIQKAISLQQDKTKNKLERCFKVVITTTYKGSGGKVLEVLRDNTTVRTSTLPEDATDNQISSKVYESLKKRHLYDTHSREYRCEWKGQILREIVTDVSYEEIKKG